MNLNFYTQWVLLMAVVGLIVYCWPESKEEKLDRKVAKFLAKRNPVVRIK